MSASVRWKPALIEHGSQYTSSGPARTYHFEFSAFMLAQASSAGHQLLVEKPVAAARRYATSGSSFAPLRASAAAFNSIAAADIDARYASEYGTALSLPFTSC